MIPARLRPGDRIRGVSPAASLGFIPGAQRSMAKERLTGLGLNVSFSKYVEVVDRFDSSPVEARVDDLHEAFADANVKGVLTTLGGYKSNGPLGHLDYDLIRNRRLIAGLGSAEIRIHDRRHDGVPGSGWPGKFSNITHLRDAPDADAC